MSGIAHGVWFLQHLQYSSKIWLILKHYKLLNLEGSTAIVTTSTTEMTSTTSEITSRTPETTSRTSGKLQRK
jgi:hypothetical protein